MQSFVFFLFALEQRENSHAIHLQLPLVVMLCVLVVELLLLRLHGLFEIVPLSLLSRSSLRGSILFADLPVPELPRLMEATTALFVEY